MQARAAWSALSVLSLVLAGLLVVGTRTSSAYSLLSAQRKQASLRSTGSHFVKSALFANRDDIDFGYDHKKCALVLDVRTQSEWEQGHISCAHRLEIQQAPAGWEKTVLMWAGGLKTTPIVVYCHSGGRAARAVEMLRAAGFANASNGGGFVVSRSVNAAGDLETICGVCRAQRLGSIGLAAVAASDVR
jgi:phage shock protein E